MMWARRVRHWRSNPSVDYLLLFKNEGLAAGASLEHLHSQFTALDKAPQAILTMWKRVAKEPTLALPTNELIISTRNQWTTFSPLAPRGAYETWITPAESPTPFIELATDLDLASELAKTIQRVLRATTRAAGASGANLVLQIAPNSMVSQIPSWWLEIAPRSSAMAGFELATNWRINAVSPEQAVKRLKASL